MALLARLMFRFLDLAFVGGLGLVEDELAVDEFKKD